MLCRLFPFMMLSRLRVFLWNRYFHQGRTIEQGRKNAPFRQAMFFELSALKRLLLRRRVFRYLLDNLFPLPTERDWSWLFRESSQH